MMMHIALVCRYLQAKRGGHERYLRRLITGLVRNNVQITAFSTAFDSDIRDIDGLDCVRVPYTRFPQWMRYLSFNKNARRAVSTCTSDFNLVFSTEYVSFGDVYRAGAGIALAEIDHYGSFFDKLFIKNQVKIHLQRKLMSAPPQSVIVNSESMRRQIIEYFHVPRESISLVYNGIDTEVFSPAVCKMHRSSTRKELGLCSGNFVCLAIGDNIKRKGIDRVVRMLENIPDRRLRLVLVGANKKHLSSIVGKRLDDRIIFCGYTDEIHRYYAAADLCIAASRYDPAPNIILEALACALPVVVSNQCGLTELLFDQPMGAVFHSLDQLAQTVQSFMDMQGTGKDEKISTSAAALGRQFTMQRHMEGILKILESVNESTEHVKTPGISGN